jgi:hypothetical protein
VYLVRISGTDDDAFYCNLIIDNDGTVVLFRNGLVILHEKRVLPTTPASTSSFRYWSLKALNLSGCAFIGIEKRMTTAIHLAILAKLVDRIISTFKNAAILTLFFGTC